jgi:hypothetical protein
VEGRFTNVITTGGGMVALQRFQPFLARPEPLVAAAVDGSRGSRNKQVEALIPSGSA